MSKSLKLIATVFALGITVNIASPSQAAAPSNAELHQMILGMMDKLGRLEAENNGLKKQLDVALNKIDGTSYASLNSPTSNGMETKPTSPVKAIVRNERQMPSSQVEISSKTENDARPNGGRLKPYETAIKNLFFPGDNKANVSISGQINRALLATTDKNDVDVFHVDNDASSTRFRILGDYNFSNDIKFGAAIEYEIEYASSDSVDQNTAGLGDDLGITDRRFELMATSKKYGSLWLGRGAMATDGTSEQDLSGTGLAGYSNVKAIAPSVLFPTGNDELSEVTVGRVFDNINGLGLSERVRYDTPSYAGFMASLSISRAGPADAALRYSGKVGDAKVVAAIGYADRDPEKLFDVFLREKDAQINGRTEIDFLLNGSASVLFENGFNLTAAWGGIQFVKARRNEPRYAYGKIGYKSHLFGFGHTAISADSYINQNFQDDRDGWMAPGLQLAQNIDAWNLEAYLGMRHYFPYLPTGRNFQNISVGMLGARWIF
jgi:hypothetical protein